MKSNRPERAPVHGCTTMAGFDSRHLDIFFLLTCRTLRAASFKYQDRTTNHCATVTLWSTSMLRSDCYNDLTGTHYHDGGLESKSTAASASPVPQDMIRGRVTLAIPGEPDQKINISIMILALVSCGQRGKDQFN